MLTFQLRLKSSTEVFFGTVCLITVRRSDSGRTGCRRCGRVDKTLVSQPCHRLGSGQSHRQRKQQNG